MYKARSLTSFRLPLTWPILPGPSNTLSKDPPGKVTGTAGGDSHTTTWVDSMLLHCTLKSGCYGKSCVNYILLQCTQQAPSHLFNFSLITYQPVSILYIGKLLTTFPNCGRSLHSEEWAPSWNKCFICSLWCRGVHNCTDIAKTCLKKFWMNEWTNEWKKQ